MSRKVRSAKGEIVDFDLLKIKSKINESPKTIDVVARERFIDKKRRRTNRKIEEMLAQQETSTRYAEEAMKQQKADRINAEENAAHATEEIVQPEVAPSVDGKTNEKFKRKINK